MIAVALLMLSVIVGWTGAKLPAPRFTLAKDQSSIAPLDPPLLRQTSDWLRRRRYVLLTFDDGPYGHGVDERILGILKRHHAHAVFFLVCARLTNDTARVPSEILDTGNMIGNHSYDHGHLAAMKPAALQHEIADCSARLFSLTGERPRYFRPPFGQTSPQVRDAAAAAGMHQVLWNANSQDSWQAEPEQILYWSMEETDNDSILLMHDKPTTANALDRVLTSLEAKGFNFVLPADQSSHGPQ
jgi:peptidoglycan/xylan/chitin deacetylase (PgdA/CDA1 family)